MSGRLHRQHANTFFTDTTSNKFTCLPSSGLLDGWDGAPADDPVDAAVDALEAAAEAAHEAAGRPWRLPDERPAEDGIPDADDALADIDRLPVPYRLRLMQGAGRAAGWRGPIPGADKVLHSGLEYRPVGLATAEEWRRREDHDRLRELAHAVARRAGALGQYVDGLALAMLTADGDAIHSEAERRAHAAQAQVRAVRATGGPGELTPNERRAMCPRAQRRRLAREIDRTDAHVSAILGAVGGPRPPKGRPDPRQVYVSDWTLARWRHRQEQGRKFLEQQQIVDKATGEVICSAAEAADSGQRFRRATMIALVHGLREIARRDGLVPVAITLTLPPEYHPAPALGRNGYDPAITPAAMFGELQARWHRVVAVLRKRRVRTVGIWLPEPHEDGTPHRHAILWAAPEGIDDLRTAVEAHFPGRRATDFRVLDERSAAQVQTYVLTYALKMTTEAPTTKAEAPDGEEHLGTSFDRFRAWKSVFGGARSWGFIGLRPGTVGRWRDLFRLAQRVERGEKIECTRTRVILRAIQRQHHATALRLMGALCDTAERGERATEIVGVYEERHTAYGDVVRLRVGVRNTRTGHEWRIKREGIALVPVRRVGVVAVVLSFPRGDRPGGQDGPLVPGAGPPPAPEAAGTKNEDVREGRTTANAGSAW
ncbi:replication endonuclease [Azospirillum thermophilum]|uniref:Replication gene A protein-like domain-containing protein n=1 Tax=Azospirillum thermophilum TaxID=2202148 RepID=A0A2S2CKL4_9PROT|nr:replication endonuclease [Azospirillum thermophilum]AWK85012.1 hypothetical protein DEW08_01395 [Azospirillum thermophilum]